MSAVNHNIKKSLKDICNQYSNECGLIDRFTNTLVDNLEDSDILSWNNFLFDVNGKECVDSVVFSPKTESLFYIKKESFQSCNKSSLLDSMELSIESLKKLNISNEMVGNVSNRYIVVISDVWMSNSNNSFADRFRILPDNQIIEHISDAEDKSYCIVLGFDRL
jgi:hypothetical protein